MPTINVEADLYITGPLGRSFVFDELQDLLFNFGLELEEEYMELVSDPDASKSRERKMYKIDVPANRFDLLCGEGISRALKCYLGISTPLYPNVRTQPYDDILEVRVSDDTKGIRPFIVAAILRDINFTKETYDSFISLQEKLHLGLCRERTLASMGTHDLDKISSDVIYYTALPPQKIKFVPLNKDKKVDGHELMKNLESDVKLNKYANIIKESPMYPVVLDSNKDVMSLPPVINSDYSKITLDTKNVFIECTATDINKAKTFVDTLCAMFSEYCKNKFTVFPVKIVYSSRMEVTPTMDTWDINVDVDHINSFLGTHISKDSVAELLLKMGLYSEVHKSDNTVKVQVPPTRRDIISEADIVEDVAIAYGYNNIKSQTCQISQVGTQQPCCQFASKIRTLLAMAGYIEVLTFTLCSREENSTFLRKKSVDAVVVSKPKAIEYEVVRTSLAPSIFKTLSSNQSHPLPIKLFEVSDVVLPASIEINDNCLPINQKRLCALVSSKNSCFEVIHGLCDWLMMSLGVEKGTSGYCIRESSDSLFLENRAVSVLYKDGVLGNFGIVHPEVLANFGISLPCSLMEIDITPLINDLNFAI